MGRQKAVHYYVIDGENYIPIAKLYLNSSQYKSFIHFVAEKLFKVIRSSYAQLATLTSSIGKFECSCWPRNMPPSNVEGVLEFLSAIKEPHAVFHSPQTPSKAMTFEEASKHFSHGGSLSLGPSTSVIYMCHHLVVNERRTQYKQLIFTITTIIADKFYCNIYIF